MTSDVSRRQTVQIKEAAHDGDSLLGEIGPDGKTLACTVKWNSRKGPFRMKVERGGIRCQGEAYMHVAD